MRKERGKEEGREEGVWEEGGCGGKILEKKNNNLVPCFKMDENSVEN
jgi:hypothetical protein